MTKSPTKEEEIINEIAAGTCYWHWPTGMVVFHDDDFDEPPIRDDSSTFGMSMLVLDELGPDVWSGYDPNHDADIDRDEVAELIATTIGWVPVGDEDGRYIRLARESVTRYGTDHYCTLDEIRTDWREWK